MVYRLTTQFVVDAHGRLLSPAPPVPDIAIAARHYADRDYAAAAHVAQQITAQQPRHFDALHLLGVLALNDGRLADAMSFLRRAERERPDDAQLQFHIGNALLALELYSDAREVFRRSLALRPGDFDALNNLGNALSGEDRQEEAIACFQEALSMRPNAPQPLFNLGRAQLALDQLEQAVASFRAALTAAREGAESDRLLDLHNSLSEALVQQRRYDEALAVCRAAPPSIAQAAGIAWNESLTLLMLGEYAEGWLKYESRFQIPDHDPPRPGAEVLDLANIAGKRVLVFPEQGRGDMIQFARYPPLLAERGAQVFVEMYADLKPLFDTIDGVARVVTPDDDVPEHDLLTPLISLLHAFGTEVSSIPRDVPYLRAPAERIERWDERLGPRQYKRIGVAWWGSQHIAKRSMPIATLVPVVNQPGIEFHALQKEITPRDRAWLVQHPLVIDHSTALEDFTDTAALISHMDLVISIDTSVAHLAGALGVPVWIMLPFSPDWRWLREREDSPWYPTARLFRQTRRGEWVDVVRRVAEALSVERS